MQRKPGVLKCKRCGTLLFRKDRQPFGSYTSAITSARKLGWRCGKKEKVCPECQTDEEKYIHKGFTKAQFAREVNRNNKLIPDFLNSYNGQPWCYGDWVHLKYCKVFSEYYYAEIKKRLKK
jgi:hypothetical protein